MNENLYTIKVPLYGYNRERIKKELLEIDNRPLKEALKEIHQRSYDHQYQQFCLSENLYLDEWEFEELLEILSEKGKAVLFRKFLNGKFHYIPATILKEKINSMGEVEELLAEYTANHWQEKLTNPNDYQIFLNNPTGEPDLAKFEKYFDLLVAIQDGVDKDYLINQYPHLNLTLENSRIPSKEELNKFRREFENNSYSFGIMAPLGVKSVEDGRSFLLGDQLWKMFEKVNSDLEHKIIKDAKKSKQVKYEEMAKAFKEMEEKWGIKLFLGFQN